MSTDYRDKFYQYKPERRENELMNEAVFNILKKLNTKTEDITYSDTDDFIVDLSDETSEEDKIKEIRHEIKNQLSILDIYTKLIEKSSGKNKNIDVIKKSLSLISMLVNELGNYEAPEIKELNIHDIVDEAVFMNDEILKVNNNKLEVIYKPENDVTVYANETKLLSVLNNIIKNANESTKDDTVILSLDTDKNFININIINHGEVINEQSAKHIFDKGFTTKKKGYGIGLYFCKKYIEEINGKLELEKSNSKETSFKISLPLN